MSPTPAPPIGGGGSGGSNGAGAASGSTLTASTGAPRKKRAKIEMACHPCRSRKVKCDGAKPQCQQCSFVQTSCSWPDPTTVASSSRKRPAKRQIASTSQTSSPSEDAQMQTGGTVTPSTYAPQQPQQQPQQQMRQSNDPPSISSGSPDFSWLLQGMDSPARGIPTSAPGSQPFIPSQTLFAATGIGQTPDLNPPPPHHPVIDNLFDGFVDAIHGSGTGPQHASPARQSDSSAARSDYPLSDSGPMMVDDGNWLLRFRSLFGYFVAALPDLAQECLSADPSSSSSSPTPFPLKSAFRAAAETLSKGTQRSASSGVNAGGFEEAVTTTLEAHIGFALSRPHQLSIATLAMAAWCYYGTGAEAVVRTYADLAMRNVASLTAESMPASPDTTLDPGHDLGVRGACHLVRDLHNELFIRGDRAERPSPQPWNDADLLKRPDVLASDATFLYFSNSYILDVTAECYALLQVELPTPGSAAAPTQSAGSPAASSSGMLSDRKPLAPEGRKRLEVLQAELSDFYEGLSETLSFSVANLTKAVKNDFGPAYFALHVRYESAMCLIHQLISLSDPEQQTSAFEVAMSAARSLADDLVVAEASCPEVVLGLPFLDLMIFIAADCCTSAFASMTGSRRFSTPKSEWKVSKEKEGPHHKSSRVLLCNVLRTNFEACQRALQSLGRTWKASQQVLERLEASQDPS